MRFSVITAAALWVLTTSFNPLPANDGAKYICFQVISEPARAEVFKSHPSEQLTTYIGTTPVHLQCFVTEHVPKGNNTIIIRKFGYQDWKMEIDLSGYYDSLPAAQKKPVLIQAVLHPVN
jgi:hypothetical protein